MTIDLHQLPIPDWGLHCARCRYPLVGLSAYRCPECGLSFRIDDLVQTWTRLRDPRFDGSELPLPDFGLDCRTCQAPLAGAATRNCPTCGEPFDPEDYRPAEEWFVIDRKLAGAVSVEVFESVLASEQVPYTQARDKLFFVLLGQATSHQLAVPTEFYFEVRWLLQRSIGEMDAARGSTEPWTCPACEEAVPGHFDLCWNCQAPRANA